MQFALFKNKIYLFDVQQLLLCGSRKYPYPTHGRDFSYGPPSPLDFPKSAHKIHPPPLRKFQFFHTHPGNTSVSSNSKNLLFKRPNFDAYMCFVVNKRIL